MTITPLDGTDVSKYQSPDPDYGTNKFVISAATQGVNIVNPNHAEQIASARRAGLLVGHYHFMDGTNPEQQADWFWTHAGWQIGELLALDIERDANGNYPVPNPVEWGRRFVVQLMRHSGFPCEIYGDTTFFTTENLAPLVALGCGVWGAAYNPSGFGTAPGFPVVAIWQNSDHDETSGGDDDRFYGDAAAWHRYGTPVGHAPVPPAPAPRPTPPAPPVDRDYTVQDGDTLGEIAARFHVNLADLVRINSIPNPDLIYPGQVLELDGTGPTVNSYTVLDGDNLTVIAEKLGTTVNHLVALNGITNPDLIFPGETLHY